MPGISTAGSIGAQSLCLSRRWGESMKLIRTVCTFLFLFLAAGVASAQTQEGRILGTVTDQSGGFINGAHVTITNVDTGVVRRLDTNEAGDYVAPNLPPGLYKLV